MLETKSYTRKLTQFVETRIKTRPRFSSRVALMTRNVRDGEGISWRMKPWWGYYSVYVPWRGWWGAGRGWRDSSAVWAGSPNVSPDAESPWCRKCFARGRRCARSAAQKSPPPRFAASGTLKSNNGPRYAHSRSLFPVICSFRLRWIIPIFGNWPGSLEKFDFPKGFADYRGGRREDLFGKGKVFFF